MAKKRKIKVFRLAGLLLVFVLVLAGIVYGFSLLNTQQEEESRTAQIENLLEKTNLELDEILSRTYPSNLSAESFALLQESARRSIYQYTHQLEQYLADGLDESEYEAAIALENPAEDYSLIFDNITYYPQNVIDLYNQDSQNLGFLIHYISQEPYLNAPESIGNVKDFPLLAQTDTRWAYFSYGNDIIGTEGSLPTALASIAAYLRQDGSITPYTIAQLSYGLENSDEEQPLEILWDDQIGYYYGYETSQNALADLVAGTYGLAMVDMGVDQQSIAQALSLGLPVLVQVIESDGQQEVGNDFMVLLGIDGDTVWIVDPANPSASGTTRSLSELVEKNIVNAKAFALA